VRSIARFVRGTRQRIARLAYLDHRVADATQARSVAAARLEVVLREQRLLARQLTLPPAEHWAGGPTPAGGAIEAGVTRCSSVCRQESLETAWFAAWLQRLRYAPRYHRKLWEYAFIGQALEERGLLRAGTRGVGFGVGSEPLSAYFASRGCRIVATEMAPDSPGAAGWSSTGQYASGREALRAPGVCADELFDANVEFRLCDMRAIPADLSGFDFCWSACALEHLGTLESGATFVERSLDCLVPGGVAVHTTELNLTSNEETPVDGPTVLYRRRDLEGLSARLAASGHEVAPFDFDSGNGVLDRYVDFPPYLLEPHLRLAIEGYASTSIAVIVRKAVR
jgi:hypothetical protein